MTQKPVSATHATSHQINELILHLMYIQQDEENQIIAQAKLECLNEHFDDKQSMITEAYQFILSCPIQQDELQWYLTQYHIWPSNKHSEKAKKIENQLIKWGNDLYHTVFHDTCNDVLRTWYQSTCKQHSFSVWFDFASHEQYNDRALNCVLSQPWHLIHNGFEYIFKKENRPVHIRCQLPFMSNWDIPPKTLPVRVLIVNSRPEDDDTLTNTDHRSIAKPIFEAVQRLGNHVSIHLLKPPTFLELELTLDVARQKGQPYHVIHFDGHWEQHPETGLPGYCFEAPEMIHDSQKRNKCIIDANQLANCMQSFDIPIVFLGTCQHPTNSFFHVISNMLQKGVSSIVTFPYQLMSETLTRFFQSFYHALIQGDHVSQAIFAAQKAIQFNALKKEVFKDRPVSVHDWFVPACFQGSDPKLFDHEKNIDFEPNIHEEKLSLLGLPSNTFVNRSQEFLYIERCLENENWAVIQAKPGEGKTALAVEMARWLLETSRVEQVAYVKLDYLSTASSVINQIGDTLFEKQLLQKKGSEEYTYEVLKRILEKRTLIIIDNMEHACPKYKDSLIMNDLEVIYSIYNLCFRLLEIPETIIIFNSHQSLEEPFDDKKNIFHLNPLSKNSAIELLYAFMKDGGYHFRHPPEGRPEGDIERLLKAVHYHPQCLKCLAPTIDRRGIKLAIRKIDFLMNKISKHYSDPIECALAASFELTIQRFSKEALQFVDYLAVFHESINQMIFTQMTDDIASIIGHLLQALQTDDPDDMDDMDDESDQHSSFGISEMSRMKDSLFDIDDMEDTPFDELKNELIQTGLAWDYRDQLIVYPELKTYLENRLTRERYLEIRRKWARGMEAFILFMNSKFSDNPSFFMQKTVVDLPNIMAFISYCIHEKSPEDIIEIIDLLDPILNEIKYDSILNQLDLIRDKLLEFMNEQTDD